MRLAHTRFVCVCVCATCRLEDTRIELAVPGGKGLHHSIDLLGFARKSEAPKKLSAKSKKKQPMMCAISLSAGQSQTSKCSVTNGLWTHKWVDLIYKRIWYRATPEEEYKKCLIAQLSGLSVMPLEIGAYSPWRSSLWLPVYLAGSITFKQRKWKSHNSHLNKEKSSHTESAVVHFLILFLFLFFFFNRS